ncbi:MAG: PIN domain-containing protein [Myxococcota bacterium]|nr:PIN domain-containing protein [Myxococcota bacterium]
MADDIPVWTLDTSVFIAAFRPAESRHDAAVALLDRVIRGERRAEMPATVLTELACAVARRTDDEAAAIDVLEFLRGHAGFSFVPVTPDRAVAAARLGARLRLRGMDALVVEVAVQARATLVTLDDEMRARSAAEVRACAPEAA